jgi:hypothetical protein
LNVLHFYYGSFIGSRLQRYLKNSIDRGIFPFLFTKETMRGNPYFVEKEKVPKKTFKISRKLAYLLSIRNDSVGLKKVFKDFDCDIVHAHGLECSYYSYKMGLPTVMDDWEFYYKYYNFEPKQNPSIKSLALRFYRRRKAKSAVKELIKNVPVIVTNWNVQDFYENLGAKHVFVIPNVPLTVERDYAFKKEIDKVDTVTTAYIGNMTADNNTVLRNTSGISELWHKYDIGDLHIFEGENYVPHLDVLRILRKFHFNLLFWKPIPIHKYYLQNKAFLASVVGVPTIISDSLTATIDLLGEYALPVSRLEDIPEVIESYQATDLPLYHEHLWEFYSSAMEKAYGCA